MFSVFFTCFLHAYNVFDFFKFSIVFGFVLFGGILFELGISPIALVPTHKNLHLPTMAEIAKETNAEILYGHGNLHAQFVENIEVGTLQVPDLLAQLQEQPGTLVVAAAGRTDIVLSLLLATQSK